MIKSRFDINASTGWVSFATGFSPDFENPVDVNSLNTYEVTIAADDENGTSYQSFTIQVTDEYEAAYFVSDNNFSALENQLVVGTVSVNDIDANDIHSFSIYPQLDDGGKFQIDQGTGELRFISSPDFENNGSIRATMNTILWFVLLIWVELLLIRTSPFLFWMTTINQPFQEVI